MFIILIHTYYYFLQTSERVFQSINDLVIKTIIAAEPELTSSLHSSGVNFRTNCFEMFGFDVFLDSNLDPQLVEVSTTACVYCLSVCTVCLPACLTVPVCVCLSACLCMCESVIV